MFYHRGHRVGFYIFRHGFSENKEGFYFWGKCLTAEGREFYNEGFERVFRGIRVSVAELILITLLYSLFFILATDPQKTRKEYSLCISVPFLRDLGGEKRISFCFRHGFTENTEKLFLFVALCLFSVCSVVKKTSIIPP